MYGSGQGLVAAGGPHDGEDLAEAHVRSVLPPSADTHRVLPRPRQHHALVHLAQRRLVNHGGAAAVHAILHADLWPWCERRWQVPAAEGEYIWPHWWKKGLWSRFIWAIGPGCQTGIHYLGPMPVPVPARTGTDRSPRGRTAARGGLGHWSRFVERTGIVDPGFFSI
jgi:hypothetical protein